MAGMGNGRGQRRIRESGIGTKAGGGRTRPPLSAGGQPCEGPEAAATLAPGKACVAAAGRGHTQEGVQTEAGREGRVPQPFPQHLKRILQIMQFHF